MPTGLFKGLVRILLGGSKEKQQKGEKKEKEKQAGEAKLWLSRVGSSSNFKFSLMLNSLDSVHLRMKMTSRYSYKYIRKRGMFHLTNQLI